VSEADAIARQAEMLGNRVRKRARHLGKWARREGVSCYRLYDRDIPEIPLLVDWYDGRLHVAEYRPSASAGERARSARWLAAMAGAVAAAVEVDAGDLYVKARQRQRGRRQYQRQAAIGARFVVEEGGHRFYVNLADYVDTGLFLDHRITRARIGSEAEGTRFLNLFCYSGSFTVYAAAGGARETLSVDLSPTYLGWAEDNLALNGLAGPAHRFARADVLALLGDPERPRDFFDLAVVDPPTFSNSKKMREVLDVQRDHPMLIERTLEMLRPGGVLYFSTSRRRFRLQADRIRGHRFEVEDMSAATTPPDFASRRPHRCWRITRS
jgi:23S rRNA G2069 N7-methylase RlmK/C1962 C5-methylase RlmI